MKKNLSKTLISVLMLGFFMAPVFANINTAKAQAPTVPLGNCTRTIPGNLSNQVTVLPRTASQYTQKECEDKNIGSGTTTYKWTPDGAPTPNSGTASLNNNKGNGDLDCSWMDWKCRIMNGFLKLIFELIALVGRFAAYVLDFFIYYSTNSASYDSTFVENGWILVRDLCNILFIISLLYVGIKMILGMEAHHGGGNKKMVGMVIIIALIINFSLFTTKVIIDATNILAKVFYNNIEARDQHGALITGGSGQISISVGLVKKFNPQRLIDSGEISVGGGNVQYAFIQILSIILMGFTIYIFFKVALLFVSRVVMLWLYMIFSPIAFLSYALPFEIPGNLGHKEFWKGLFENAFLAPLFVFFLYLIIMFLGVMDKLPTYTGSGAEAVLDLAMKTMVPFLLLYIMLDKAKDLAVQYAGKMGEGIQKMGAAVGGLGLGVTAATTAMLGRGVLGGIMRKVGETRFEKNATAGRHARHDLNQISAELFDGRKFDKLSNFEKKQVRDREARNLAQADAGFGHKTWKQLTVAEQQNVTDRLTVGHATYNASYATKAQEKVEKSKYKEGIFAMAARSAREGSWDVRNLSEVTTAKEDVWYSKPFTALFTSFGKSMRGALKGALDIDYGKSQKNIIKDLGHIFEEALKKVKINVDLGHVGDVKKEDGHGGGHH